MYYVYEIVLRSAYPGTDVRRTVYEVSGRLLNAAAQADQRYGPGWVLVSAAECEDLDGPSAVHVAIGRIRMNAYSPPRVQSCTPGPDRKDNQ